MELIFTAGGYDFYRDAEGFWQCVHEGAEAPARGAYGRADALARLKNVPLHLVPADAARQDNARRLDTRR